MNTYKKLLFPTALIEQSLGIGQRAEQLAKKFGAKLSLLHVIEPEYKYWLLQDDTSVNNELMDVRSKQLSELGRAISVREADQHLRIGAPKIQILEVARQIAADLIVIGSHAHHGYMHVLGSTAIAVAHSAPCDVLTIRINGSIIEKYQRILFATALVKHSSMVAERASDFAKSVGAKLSIMHVMEPIPGYGFGAVPSDEIEEKIEQRTMGQLIEMAKSVGISRQDAYIKSGSPKSRILETADELSADLIIIASHGRNGVAHLLGSTAISVVHSATCDVLTVRVKDTTVTVT